MTPTQHLLFGDYPRRVGTPAQHWVFNEAQFDVFLDTIRGTRNAYATVGTLPVVEGQPEVSDKVLFDLDGDKSVFEDEQAADERVAMMRDDPDIADSVLGDVCDEAQQLARASRDDGIPVLGVFSGFGIHVHQLYQPTEDPTVPMTTCAAKYIEELDLQTADWKVVGQPERICRVPNMPRVTHETSRTQSVEDGRSTGLWTVPMDAEVLEQVTPGLLVEKSHSPIELPGADPGGRPQMPVWEEYRDGVTSDTDQPQRPVDKRTSPLAGEMDVEGLLWELVSMPCMVERMLQPNPEHEVRMNGAVMLFNVGLNPQQVEDLYARLGWVDFDRGTTRKHLKSIYRSGYSDMSCSTLREKRLCTRSEEPSECPTFGWSGGACEWKQ